MVTEASESTRREYAARMNQVVDPSKATWPIHWTLSNWQPLPASVPSTSTASFAPGWERRYKPLSTDCVLNARLSYWSSIGPEHFRHRAGMRFLKFQRICPCLQGGLRGIRRRMAKAQDLSSEPQSVGSGRS